MERSMIAYWLIVAWLLFVIFAIVWRITDDVQRLLQSDRIEIEYTCINYVKAAVLDTEKERRCGFNCVDPRNANATVFIWERTPKKVVFVNNLNYTVRVHHVVNGVVYSYVDLLPGESAVFITITENDYFIETRFKHREWFSVGEHIYYTSTLFCMRG